ncbi:transcriptional regulator, TetR family [Enterococcus faecalis TX0102]|uniref:TetR/AcrR family transcriptional regulator n=1 Tax=Enterococcus faecalis TaxID=1351 RepID=UPI0001E71817|nr:TetR/AcrR family transcriptional regulator [Enterococcus faecalis]EFQ11946.1 transcriptional regulator, TetR family [Enterococcus faecalis TX0102]EFT96137.1 transcriptional regulator, TetR family [Enterococcus faecalis TX0031]EOJ68413.1 hypothetical protein WMW_01869 [Enterococcus faecalis EnGen0352]MDI7831922.1 TetR/AcrR family transcriptional regulator [Enterococcus faecalis]NSS20234.1 TetR/AcrR family transcriptional regulator [Enterococcus faecalis]
MSRAEKTELTKTLLFNTSIRLFKERGYADTTVSSICKAAGVAKGTFYVHYESKESIIKQSYYLNLTQFMEQHFVYQPNIKDKEEIKESIIQFLTLELAFAEEMGIETTTLAFTFNLGDSLKGKNLHFSNRNFTKVLYRLIDQLDQELDRDYLFHTFESLVRGIMATWCFSEGKFNLMKDGEKMIRDMLESYLK